MLGTPPAFVLSQDQTLKKLYLKAEALKSKFWINLSSKITQEFSLAVNFDLSSLKQSIIIVQGVLFVFALFNLQGTVFVAHRCQRVSSLILSQFVSFVKNFFQVFQTFFELFFQSSPSATFLFYHIFQSLSRAFFKFFSFSEECALCMESEQRIALLLRRRKPPTVVGGYVLALPIFPGSRPPSIGGACELNFCVRDGNRWTLTAINTNLYRWLFTIVMSKRCRSNSFWILPHFAVVVNPFLHAFVRGVGDPYRIRTDVNGVRGRCLNHLTNGPLVHLHGLEPGTHWLRVSCSTNWAKGADPFTFSCTLKTEHCSLSTLYLKTSLSLRFGQAFGLLVSVSYTHCCASTSDLSTT